MVYPISSTIKLSTRLPFHSLYSHYLDYYFAHDTPIPLFALVVSVVDDIGGQSKVR